MTTFKIYATVPSADGSRLDWKYFGVSAADVAQAAAKFIAAFPDAEVMSIERIGKTVE